MDKSLIDNFLNTNEEYNQLRNKLDVEGVILLLTCIQKARLFEIEHAIKIMKMHYLLD